MLFNVVLDTYRITPDKLGYDRPSEKLIAFNAKHFGLKSYVPQNNNYVVYDAYFNAPAQN
jgi:alpha-tubulin N-acetyltransferase 1